VTREIGEPLRRLALLVKAKGGRDSVICVDPALNTRTPSEELDDGCWIGYCEQLVVGLVKAGDERLNRFCVEARILWELDFNVPGLLSAVRLTPDELDTQIKQPTPRASVDEGGPNRPDQVWRIVLGSLSAPLAASVKVRRVSSRGRARG
jgi:hypothetical protein